MFESRHVIGGLQSVVGATPLLGDGSGGMIAVNLFEHERRQVSKSKT